MQLTFKKREMIWAEPHLIRWAHKKGLGSSRSKRFGKGPCSKECGWPQPESGFQLTASNEMRVLVLQPQESNSATTTWVWKRTPTSRWEHALANILILTLNPKQRTQSHYAQTSELQDCELINGCFLKPLNLC